ncbi:nuclear pore complex protein Nup98-Nup96 [Leguminivora glycinivorella]|uniref:nuclear pore complex protein Nup98-Nup96 n=1 Tax=Leguminivora glycinivorella TaxID=1035111 RepID=UPI00200EFB02|nr:nuclear pore complex protein Nup98-Nup96 [Leguminivora glycinivorella]
MFQKPTFGANSSGFGSFNAGATTSSPFGGGFKSTTNSAFGAPPAFGAAAQPATGGGLFGSTNTSSGVFGTTNTSGFGSGGGFGGFGASSSTGGGLFGASQPAPLFGAQQQPFQAKPAGFGFGATSTSTAGTTPGSTLFGAAPATGGMFGQQPAMGGTLFGNNTGGFGQQQTASGTAHAKYNPVVGTDVVVKSGTSQNINIKHHCITCMKEYENKSLEELRLEDYTAGRKGAQGGGVFGFSQPQENKPLFGGSTFGAPATTSAGVFGGGGLGASTTGFGNTSTFSFGGGAQNTTQTNSLFGASKPAFGATSTVGTGLFGATTTQAPSFGTATSTFGGFGTNTATQPSTGLFGAKPATTGFGATPSSGFGSFGSGGGGLFGAKPAAPPAFGSLNTSGFGTTTSTSGGLFGANNTFGKPATQPTFGFNQPTLGGGLGTNTFQAKPAGPAFGSLGGGSLFQQPQQQTTFKTDGLGGGLGGGMFGNTSGLGGLGGLGAPQTFGTNTSFMGQSGLSATPQNNVHEQILSLVARPYGDSPLFKDLVPDTSTTAEDALKPTNPAAVAAVLANDANYRVGSSVSRLKVLPRATSHPQKSLFDGLEEYDASLDDQLTLKPSRKRLVLRPKNTPTLEPETQNRSLDEQNHRDVPTQTEKEKDGNSNDDADGRRNHSNNNNIELSSEKNASWLSSPKGPWNDKEKHNEEEPTSRLYPDLDKELPAQFPERRSSWLTTKPLRKPLPSAAETSAEHSVRELGVRSERDKENIDSLSEEESMTREPPPAAPHPAGVKLTRPGYYTIPSLEEMIAYMRPDGSCVVPHLTIGRKNYGNVFYDCEVDVANLDLDALVHFLNKEVIVYPEDSDKPPVGQGLNRRAVVTLDRIWPRDKTEKTPITDPERLLTMDYEGKLRRVCDKHDTKFIEYRPQTGSWVFRVEHFSKYGLTDSDEEDDPTPTVLKRQLVNESLQKNAAPGQIPPVPTAPGLGGLGGLSGLAGPGLRGLAAPGLGDDSLYAMQHTSLDLLGQAGKAFDMDTAEDNGEPQSLYDSTRGFGVKSPTAELARLENRQSHHVQLMKASIYADDMDMDDGTSTSTGDQQVPAPRSVFRLAPRDNLPPVVEETGALVHLPDISTGVDLPMRPLIVNPEKIVLKYHRKVLPFKLTIAGKLDAACIADFSVSRARHSRVGFGPGGAMVFASTYDTLVDLPRAAQLSEIGKYVAGRAEDDWSEPVVARLAVGQTDTTNNFMTTLTKQMENLLEWSTSIPKESPVENCPRLTLKEAPRDRREALKALRERAGHDRDGTTKFGVSGAYCYEVWTLCEALWGADLDNGGVPGTDDLSIVNRHRELLRWLTQAVAAITDRELQRPCKPEPEDESDTHSARVWTLLLGGRLLEACKLSRDKGDMHMASLIAQAAGDGVFRSLIARQLSQWRECGAESTVSAHRLASLQLLAGLESPRTKLMEGDWLQTLHAVARYICAPIPSLEHVIRTYESFFVEPDEGPADMTVVTDNQMELKCPLPPYMGDYDVSVHYNGKQRRVLDLRYELLRARAFNQRPKFHPAAYTPDPTDYSLSFLLGVWFGDPTIESITGVAEQLEAVGQWHLAVQALAHHPNDAARGHLIRGVLSRHAPARADTAELRARLDLIETLQVPRKWVLLAQAHRAKYEHLPAVEVEHLVGAEQWNAAHKVLLEELLPEAVLADDLRSIAPLLEQLNEAAERHEVSGWQHGGQALHHYIRVCDEIRSLVSCMEADRESVQTRLEALRPRVAAACRAQAGLAVKTPWQCAARAEMGARLLQLAVAAREPPAQLAALLAALPLPPDCTATARQKRAARAAGRPPRRAPPAARLHRHRETEGTVSLTLSLSVASRPRSWPPSSPRSPCRQTAPPPRDRRYCLSHSLSLCSEPPAQLAALLAALPLPPDCTATARQKVLSLSLSLSVASRPRSWPPSSPRSPAARLHRHRETEGTVSLTLSLSVASRPRSWPPSSPRSPAARLHRHRETEGTVSLTLSLSVASRPRSWPPSSPRSPAARLHRHRETEGTRAARAAGRPPRRAPPAARLHRHRETEGTVSLTLSLSVASRPRSWPPSSPRSRCRQTAPPPRDRRYCLSHSLSLCSEPPAQLAALLAALPLPPDCTATARQKVLSLSLSLSLCSEPPAQLAALLAALPLPPDCTATARQKRAARAAGRPPRRAPAAARLHRHRETEGTVSLTLSLCSEPPAQLAALLAALPLPPDCTATARQKVLSLSLSLCSEPPAQLAALLAALPLPPDCTATARQKVLSLSLSLCSEPPAQLAALLAALPLPPDCTATARQKVLSLSLSLSLCSEPPAQLAALLAALPLPPDCTATARQKVLSLSLSLCSEPPAQLAALLAALPLPPDCTATARQKVLSLSLSLSVASRPRSWPPSSPRCPCRQTAPPPRDRRYCLSHSLSL